MTKTLTPNQYADQVWGGIVTGKTIRNWIAAGRKLKNVNRVETTPTGHYVLFMDTEQRTQAQKLADMLKAKAA